MERRSANSADYASVSTTDKGAVAIQVEAVEIDAKRGHPISDLTWDDTYYELEDNIVAVFDFASRDLQASVMSKLCVVLFRLIVIGIVLVTLIMSDFENYRETATYWIIFSYGCYLFFCVCIQGRLVMLVYSSQCHFALTTQCVRYDQSNPEIHTMVCTTLSLLLRMALTSVSL